MIQFFLECIVFQLLFLVIYDLFLKRETFFQWNRVYLMGTYVVSIVLPWVKIEAFKTNIPEEFIAYPEYLWNMNMQAITLSGTENSSLWNISLANGILFGGMVLAALLFGYKIYQIYRLREKGEVHYFQTFTRVIIEQSKTAFSFFRTIFMGDQIVEEEYASIVQHELVHIEQKHSLDLLFFELMRIVGWFNPLVYVYQNRISELHEFIADAQVSKTHKKEQYQLLLSQVFQTQNISFVNQFFKSSLIKKRIVMLQKQKSKKVYQLKYLLLLPLVMLMLAYSSSSNTSDMGITLNLSANKDTLLIKQVSEKIQKQILEKGSISNVYLSSQLPEKFKSGVITSKTDFFEYKLLYRQYVNELLTITYPSLGEKVPEEIIEKYGNPPLPSSKFYEAFKAQKDLSGPIIPFGEVEKAPIFPGCENAEDKKACFQEKLREHIRKNFNYPEYAQELGLQGRVNILFTIQENGTIGNIRYRGPHELLEDEALRIIKKLPKMIAGEHDGEVVNVAYSIPITFKLSEDINIKESSNGNFLNNNVPFATVDEVPVFPGCENAENKKACFNEKMNEHIRKNFWYPKEAQDKGVQGRVNIMFTINENGYISNIRKRGPDRRLEDVATAIVSRLPKMIPGKHKGKVVNVPYSIPITFKLR